VEAVYSIAIGACLWLDARHIPL